MFTAGAERGDDAFDAPGTQAGYAAQGAAAGRGIKLVEAGDARLVPEQRRRPRTHTGKVAKSTAASPEGTHCWPANISA